MASKILSGDEIEVIHGRNKGARGRVRRHLGQEDKVIVEGVNIVRKHVRREMGQRAGIVEMEAPLWKSKVMLVCPSCGEPTRVGFRTNANGEKVRYCKECGAELPKQHTE